MRAFIKLYTVANTDSDTNTKTVVVSDTLGKAFRKLYTGANTYIEIRIKIHKNT